MKFFYLSTFNNSQGLFEIHHRECPNLPSVHHRDYIGPFNNEKEALKKAINFNPNASLCPICSKKTVKSDSSFPGHFLEK
jgi:transposase